MSVSLSIDDIIKLANSGYYDANHSTTKLTIGKMSAEIDNLLVPLVERLWTQGIATSFSCQGKNTEDDDGYISFRSKSDLIEFCRRVTDCKLYSMNSISRLTEKIIDLSTIDELNQCNDDDLFSVRFKTDNIDRIVLLV